MNRPVITSVITGVAAQGASPSGNKETPALLKAEAAWKKLIHNPSVQPMAGTQTVASTAAPLTSRHSASSATRRTSSITSPGDAWSMASRTTRWPFNPSRPPRAITVSTAKVIRPRPPR